MSQNPTLEQIRESERKSHMALYSGNALYREGSWLKKPVRTVTDLIPLFRDPAQLHILDLGCGVGRNAIFLAQHFDNIPCTIDCVDILPFAIEKLYDNAAEYGVAQSIHGIVKPIEGFFIPNDHYDWIIAVSALEHVDSYTAFVQKLAEIRDGIRKNGIVSIVINSY